MAIKTKTKGVVTVSFIECVVKNDCWEYQAKTEQIERDVWRFYQVWKEDGAEVWIVRPDGLRRAWSFKIGSIIQIGLQVIQFNKDDVIEELTVDEDAQQGKQKRPTVV